MYLIAGLGNPGDKYAKTRHNVGFVAIDYLALKFGISVKKIKFKALIGEGVIGGERVILAKPTTFMNLSGESILEIAKYYKLPPENIIIIYDDTAIEVGKIRIRPGGSDGGHNGMKSIIYLLGSDAFPRIRVGIGKAKDEMVGHVLGTFSKPDGEAVTKCIKATDKIVEEIIKNGAGSAMNKFNGATF